MILADFGLLKESIAYALEARALVQEIGVAGKFRGFVFLFVVHFQPYVVDCWC